MAVNRNWKRGTKYTVENGYIFYQRLVDSDAPHWWDVADDAQAAFAHYQEKFVVTTQYGKAGKRLYAYGNMLMYQEIDWIYKNFGIRVSPREYQQGGFYQSLAKKLFELKSLEQNFRKEDLAKEVPQVAKMTQAELIRIINAELTIQTEKDMNNLINKKEFVANALDNNNVCEKMMEKMLVEKTWPKVIDKVLLMFDPEDEHVQKLIKDLRVIDRKFDKHGIWTRNKGIFKSAANDLTAWVRQRKRDEQNLKGKKAKVGSTIKKETERGSLKYAVKNTIERGFQRKGKRATLNITMGKVTVTKLPEIIDFSERQIITTSAMDAYKNDPLLKELDKIMGKMNIANKTNKDTDIKIISQGDMNIGRPEQKIEGELTTLPATISKYDPFMAQNTEIFITIILNTMPNALWEGKSVDVMNQFKKVMSQSIAAWLFGEYETKIMESAKSTNNPGALEIFFYDGKYVPLSIIIMAISKAMQAAEPKATKFLDPTYVIPQNILWPERIEPNQGFSGFSMEEYWNIQRQQARTSSKYMITVKKKFDETVRRFI